MQSAKAYNINVSDHLLVVLIYKKSREIKRSISITSRSYSDTNITAFCEAVRNYNWSKLLVIQDPNLLWDEMFSVFINILNETCPLKTFTISKDRPPYINHDIILLGHERDKLFKIARKSGLESDWLAARRQRQKVNYAIKKAKSNYFKQKLKECKGDSKKFWNIINEIISEKRAKEITTITDKSKELDVTGLCAANYLNKYFCEIGDKLVEKLPNVNVLSTSPAETTQIDYV